jgi:hypothetical protein
MRAGFSFSYPSISLLLGQPLSIKRAMQERYMRKVVFSFLKVCLRIRIALCSLSLYTPSTVQCTCPVPPLPLWQRSVGLVQISWRSVMVPNCCSVSPSIRWTARHAVCHWYGTVRLKDPIHHGRRNFKDTNPLMSSLLVILFGVVKQFCRFLIWSEPECKTPAEYGLQYNSTTPGPPLTASHCLYTLYI